MLSGLVRPSLGCCGIFAFGPARAFPDIMWRNECGGGKWWGVKAIPVVARERILRLDDQGEAKAEIAASFAYCVAAMRRVRQHFKARGTLEPQTHRCDRKTLLTEARKDRLLRRLARQPDATLAELGALVKRPASTADLWLNRQGWSHKTKRCPPPSRRGPTWRSREGSGRNGWRGCPPPAWCSWMKAGSTRR